MSILEGLVKTDTTISTAVDMSKENNTTHNVEKIENHYHYAPQIVLQISDADAAVKIAETFARHLQSTPEPTKS